ncbi:MAG: GntR family transcriptional regulator [Acidisphaera sp.]|nr:GntR family transcriptional regulator [Acidisphaera sp.]
MRPANEGAQITAISAVSNSTQATTVYDRIRSDLLSAKLQPGFKLSMRFLMETYDTGQTPIREALNRLAAERLVEFRDQRGFTVAGISSAELAELTKARSLVEALVLREAMAAATPEWEEQLVLAHHRLARARRSLNAGRFEDNPEWERLHRAFHRTLIAQCGSSTLTNFCRHLADLLYRYRRISIGKAYPWRDVGAEHAAILEAVLGGDREKAVALLTRHYSLTAEIISSDLNVFPDEETKARTPEDLGSVGGGGETRAAQ